MASAAAQPITCTAGLDCEVKWGKAVTWLNQNSAYRIAQQTDMLISTMGPSANSPQAAFTATKTARPDGTYVIELNGGCDNLFGCTPSITNSKASFANALNAK